MLHFDHPELLDTTGPSRYRRAVEHGYRWLRFEPELECEFERFHTAANLVRVRWAACLALSLFALFVVIDLTTLPLQVARWTASIRAFVIMPAFVVVLVASHRADWHPRLQRTIALASLITGLGTVAVIGAALHAGHPIPYEGILLVALFISLIACLSWWRALAVNLATLAAFIGMEFALQPDAEARLYRIVFMCAANAVGAYGGYFLERGIRTTFLVNALLNELAERDGLTGLYNRRTFNAHLDKAWRQAGREQGELAVAMIDVDHFKRYNDRYGHTGGDAALQAVAGVIALQARRPLDLAARYGGEEFAMIWYRPAADELETLGEQLRAAVAALGLEHADSDGGRLGVSIGIALMAPAADRSSAALLRAADTALYRAKQQGRNRVVVLARPDADALLF